MIGCTGVPNAGDDEKTNASFCFRIESIVVLYCSILEGSTSRGQVA
jgi:hypothetical protein